MGFVDGNENNEYHHLKLQHASAKFLRVCVWEGAGKNL